MSYKHKDLGLIPRICVRKLDMVGLALGRQRELEPWGLLASQRSRIGEASVSETPSVQK